MSSDRTNEKRDELWEKYSKTKDLGIREQLIIEYSYLIKYIAGRLNMYLGSNVDYNDLMSYGVFGLIDAVDKFDINKGVKFETYASLRIRGSIIDSMRELDWVPRSLRQKSKQLEKVYGEIENELGRSVTDKEIAGRMGISVHEFGKLLNEVNVSVLVSLEEYMEQNYEFGGDIVSQDREAAPEKQLELAGLRDVLGEGIDCLPEKERTVITLYYYEELTLKEISSIMGVSESRISQLHTKALMRMRGKLSRHRNSLLKDA